MGKKVNEETEKQRSNEQMKDGIDEKGRQRVDTIMDLINQPIN